MPLVRSIARDAAKRRQQVLGARARRRQEQAVSDEHEDAGTAPTQHGRPSAERTIAIAKGATSHVHHEKTHSAPDVPAGAPASRWRCRCSTRWCRRARLLAQTAAAPKQPLRGDLLPARHGARLLGAGAGGRAAGEAAATSSSRSKNVKDQTGRAERPLVEVGGAAGGHDRIGPLGGRRVPDRHQAAQDRRVRRHGRQRRRSIRSSRRRSARRRCCRRCSSRSRIRTRARATAAKATAARTRTRSRGSSCRRRRTSRRRAPARCRWSSTRRSSSSACSAAARRRKCAPRGMRAEPQHSRFAARRAGRPAEESRRQRPPHRQPVHRRNPRDRAPDPARGEGVETTCR